MNKSLIERRYWQTHRQCVQELADAPLQGKRGRAGYVCGDLIAQMTAAALPDHDLFAFWNGLRDAAKQRDQRKLIGNRYFALLREHGALSALVDSLQRLVTTRLEHPENALAEAMRASELDPRFAADGGLSTMLFPAIGSAQ